MQSLYLRYECNCCNKKIDHKALSSSFILELLLGLCIILAQISDGGRRRGGNISVDLYLFVLRYNKKINEQI